MAGNIDGNYRVGALLANNDEQEKKQVPTWQERLQTHAAGVFDFAAKNPNLNVGGAFNG